MKRRIATALFVRLLAATSGAQQPTQKASQGSEAERAEKRHEGNLRARINQHCQSNPNAKTPVCALSTEDLKNDALSGDCGHPAIYMTAGDALAIYTPNSGETYTLKIVPAPNYPVCGNEKPPEKNCEAHPFPEISDMDPPSSFWYTGPLKNTVKDHCYYRVLINFGGGRHKRKHDGDLDKDRDFDPHIIVGSGG